jgi:hypothetical protein
VYLPGSGKGKELAVIPQRCSSGGETAGELCGSFVPSRISTSYVDALNGKIAASIYPFTPKCAPPYPLSRRGFVNGRTCEK